MVFYDQLTGKSWREYAEDSLRGPRGTLSEFREILVYGTIPRPDPEYYGPDKVVFEVYLTRNRLVGVFYDSEY